MDENRFDAAIRRLGERATRRGAIGLLAGISGLAANEVASKRRKRQNRRRVSREITYGELDGNGHPYVGLMVAQDTNGGYLWRCSGTLLSETIFLTAGHCTEAPAAHVEIWFDADVESGLPTEGDPGNGYPKTGDAGGTPYTHPQYDPNAFALNDLGVVQIETWRIPEVNTFGALPALDELDRLAPKRGKKDLTFTAVGYGIQKSFPSGADWKNQEELIRMVARPKLLQINNGHVGDFSILLSNNIQGGGTCFGDSGGPNFIEDSNVIGGVTSYGNNDTCAGTGGVYRVDRVDDLNWLATFGVS